MICLSKKVLLQLGAIIWKQIGVTAILNYVYIFIN